MRFSRYGAENLRSFAMRSFNLRETEINKHYWSFVVVSEYAAYQARAATKENAECTTRELFHASGVNAPRIPQSAIEWLTANDDLKNWLRLSALVSAAANLEMYLGNIVRTALMSDPLVKFGKTKSIDGVSLLKKGVEMPYEDIAESITKGDWSARESNFLKCFGVASIALHNNKSELEEIRNARNSFAHGFGRDLKIPLPLTIDSGKAIKLSQEKLQRHLKTISSVAKEIDRLIMNTHVGNFEIIYCYHKHLEEIKNQKQVLQKKRLKELIYVECGITVSERFCNDLIEFYKIA